MCEVVMTRTVNNKIRHLFWTFISKRKAAAEMNRKEHTRHKQEDKHIDRCTD